MAILSADQMRTKLNEAASEMSAKRDLLGKARDRLTEFYTWLDNLGTKYADVLETTQKSGYGDTDADEAANKAAFTALVGARNAFRTQVNALITWWDANITEF
jgi:hypothetical protein